MATTEPRAGFRPPWRSDHAMERDGSAERDAAAQGAPEGALDASFDADSTAALLASHDATADRDDASDPSVTSQDAATPAAPAARKPTKFLAGLTKAMHGAAETERAAALEQLHADSKSFVEQIHARSADAASDLKRRSEEDIASIREWSKAEIARIREETEHRITERKGQLDGELEEHAAQIERQIDRVQRRVAAFEHDMARFFEDLLVLEDPAAFAGKASQLPDPPTFEALQADGDSEWDVDPEPPVVEAVSETGTGAETARDLEASVGVTDDQASGRDATVEVSEGSNDVAPGAEPSTGDATELATGAALAVDGEASGDTAPEPVAVMATDAEPGSVEAVDAETAETSTHPDVARADAEHDSVQIPADDHRWDSLGLIGDSGAADTSTDAAAEADPRLAALGIGPDADDAPDFAGAEAAAVEAAMTDDQIVEIGEESLAARLAGLVPGTHTPAADDAAPQQAAVQSTQVVVVGLVSVASIASFKRQLGRLAGVQGVGVASGPDGEFVFTVKHGDGVSLRDIVPTLPGFQARVVKAGEGIINVSAHDPEADN